MKQNNYFSFFIFLFSPKKTFASKLTIRDFAILAQLLSFSFYLLSCSTPTENNKVTFSGTVTLEDTSDFSGVTVSLYAPVELDTALVRINEEYPNIGIRISQETEFDHREHTPLYTTTTKADGSWEIKADKGEYNIVAEKEGWGWEYDFGNTINKKQYLLYKTVVLAGYKEGNIKLENNHHYVITEDVNFAGNSNLTIETGAWIRVKSNKKIEISGVFEIVNSNGNFIHVINEETEQWDKIVVLNSAEQVNIKNLILSNSRNGLKITDLKIEMNNCIFQNSTINSTYLKNPKAKTLISGNLFRNNEIALNLFNDSEEISISKNIYYKCITGITVYNSKTKIINNLFLDSEFGMSINNYSNPIVKNNTISNANRCIKMRSLCNPIVSYNIFRGSKDYTIVLDYPASGTGPSQPIINNNNFISKTKFIYMGGAGVGGMNNTLNINASNNYWGVENYNSIEMGIWDSLDVANDPTKALGRVNVIPFLETIIDNAGIIKDE